MSNVKAVYPNGIFTWTDKVDQVNVDFANDINSVASEVISVESTLGTTPTVENNPPSGGTKVTYNTVDDRISDAINNSQLPACSVTASSFIVPNTTIGVVNQYKVNYDPYDMFNGTDITIIANGWYLASTHQWWNWWSDGYVHHSLQLNGELLDEDLVDWQFSGNVSSVSTALPRWQTFGKRSRLTRIFWQGLLHKGDRITALSENGTSNSSFKVTNMNMKVAMLRSTTGSFASG